MNFDHKTTDELLRIIEAGLGLTLNTNGRSPDDIQRIQAAAVKSGAKVTWVDAMNVNFTNLTEPIPTLTSKPK